MLWVLMVMLRCRWVCWSSTSRSMVPSPTCSRKRTMGALAQPERQPATVLTRHDVANTGVSSPSGPYRSNGS